MNSISPGGTVNHQVSSSGCLLLCQPLDHSLLVHRSHSAYIDIIRSEVHKRVFATRTRNLTKPGLRVFFERKEETVPLDTRPAGIINIKTAFDQDLSPVEYVGW